MKYRQTEKPERAEQGSRSFAHEVQIEILASDYDRVLEFLSESFGSKHVDWRISKGPQHTPGAYWYFHKNAGFRVNVRFAESREAMRFKLTWA